MHNSHSSFQAFLLLSTLLSLFLVDGTVPDFEFNSSMFSGDGDMPIELNGGRIRVIEPVVHGSGYSKFVSYNVVCCEVRLYF